MATVASEQIKMSRATPLRGAEGGLDILICSEKRVAVRSTAFPQGFMGFDRNLPSQIPTHIFRFAQL
jgi:hypothetical protein